MSILVTVTLLVVAVAAGLQAWRWSDTRRADRVWATLERLGQHPASTFDPSIVEHLPEPARRYFLYTIKAGTPIWTVTKILMSGEIGLGTQDKPNYMPMRAKQILAPPHGLVWNVEAGRGLMHISGSDGFDGATSWVHFWLSKTIPIVRVGGSNDHARAAFGRVVAEAVFWAPATLLPGDAVSWEAVSADVARATVNHGGMVQTVDVTVAEDGRPTTVVIPRWSNANLEKTYQLQPFGGFLSEFRDFDGYRLATHVEGGNLIGTEGYFPFYKAQVVDLRFVRAKNSEEDLRCAYQ
jgi:hypothetical protein